jgi:membrane protein DedA with SNARE-associated domain
MSPSIFQAIGHWAAGGSYLLLFVAMMLEGPVVTAAGAFAAADHILNGYLVFLISVLGNLIPDGLYYALGYWGREKFIDRYGRYIGLSKEKMERAQKMLQQHAGKSMIAIKLIPFLSTTGLVAAGATKMDIKKYAFWSIAITIPSSLVYFLIGYYAGAAYGTIIHYVNTGGYVIVALIALSIALVYLIRTLSAKWAERFEGK